MNNTDQRHLPNCLMHIRGPEHLAQITVEMSKKVWSMKKTHSEDQDGPVWKPFPGTEQSAR